MHPEDMEGWIQPCFRYKPVVNWDSQFLYVHVCVSLRECSVLGQYTPNGLQYIIIPSAPSTA